MAVYSFTPHKTQLQVLQAKKRFKVIVCGRRWGKTTLAINYLILEALANKKGGDYWYIAPTYRQAKTIAWRILRNRYFALPKELRGEKNEAELWVTVGNSRISLKGADNEDSLRGSGLWGIVCDEVANYRNWEYLWQEVLRPALSDYRGFAWFIGTPKGFNHFYTIFNYEKDYEDYISFHFTSYDNPFLPSDEIEKAKQELTEDAFAQEYLADFRKHTGLIYKEFDRTIHVVESFEIPNHWELYRAMDFGASNPTVCLWIARDNADNVYVIDEYYQANMRTDSHARIIGAKTGTRVVTSTFGDPSGEQAILDYALYNIYITPANKLFSADNSWVNSGIDKIGELLKVGQDGRPHLYIFKHCSNLIREFESYHWMEKRHAGLLVDLPEKIDDHCLDALRYFVVSYGRQQNEEIEPVYIPRNRYTGY